MGQDTSKLPPPSLKNFIQEVQLSEAEINVLQLEMKNEYPTEQVHIDEWKRWLKKKYPDGDPTAFAEHLFKAYDLNGNGVIELREIVTLLYWRLPKNAEKKMKWTFNFYDTDKDGKINRKEAHEALTAMYKCMGQLLDYSGNAKSLETAVDSFFQKLDTNADGLISFAEFVNVCKEDKNFWDYLEKWQDATP